MVSFQPYKILLYKLERNQCGNLYGRQVPCDMYWSCSYPKNLVVYEGGTSVACSFLYMLYISGQLSCNHKRVNQSYLYSICTCKNQCCIVLQTSSGETPVDETLRWSTGDAKSCEYLIFIITTVNWSYIKSKGTHANTVCKITVV